MQKVIKIKDGGDVTKVLTHAECPIRSGKGSHRVARLPNGETLTYYEHGEYPKGTLQAILKALIRAGLPVAVLVAVFYLISVMP